MTNESFFADEILQWYEKNRRFLPWRGTKDPYRIWISEIILQQTRVAQGYDYFVRFIERFPDVQALAAASEDEVLRCWQGLGYYSRARNLHCAARQIVASGGFPMDYEGIRNLKGVGDYTAAAIASFAFGLPHAVVDGNVYRVLSRYFGVDEAIDTGRGRKCFAELAQALLPDRERVADYNQGLMDFGALQCVPKSPRCMDCPLNESCMAFREGRVKDLPVKVNALIVSKRYLHYFWVQVGEEMVLFRREGKDIWKGLYEPMLVETDTACSPEALFDRQDMPSFLLAKDGVRTLLCAGICHQLTHRTLICDFHHVVLQEKPTDEMFGRKACWIHREELSDYAMPRLVTLLLEKSGILSEK